MSNSLPEPARSSPQLSLQVAGVARLQSSLPRLKSGDSSYAKPSVRNEILCGLAFLCFVVTAVLPTHATERTRPDVVLADFDVVIAGGSTAAFAAAIASAESGARTALLEPTDWVGGQLTSSAVPAVDEAWHTIKAKAGQPQLKVFEIARNPANMTPDFAKMLTSLQSQGDCWVSRFCFCPRSFLKNQLLPLQRRAGNNLVVYLETVVKRVTVEDGKITSLTAVRRFPRPETKANGYDLLPSVELADWYSPTPSKRFDKQLLKFQSRKEKEHRTVFIEATEWGEVLALSGGAFLQGAEDVDGGTTGDDTCGQSTVFCFVEEFLAEPQAEPRYTENAAHFGYADYQGKPDAWQKIWTYRRIRGQDAPSPGDLCLQNWGYSVKRQQGGNDYPFAYLFKSKQETAAERDDWRGGINLDAMAGAEQRAYGWHQWFKEQAPEGIDPQQICLDLDALGTGHGLAKLPYIRDTRRAIGLDGFLLTYADLSGNAGELTGRRFADRVALGAYPADVHPLSSCKLPAYVHQAHDTLPFYIPFRALTCDGHDNLLVAGKTMAQSFLANSATRLHPIEWSSGTAAGVAAAYMARTGKTSREAYESIGEIQKLIRQRTPIEWTIDGKLYPDPAAGSALLQD